MFSCRKMIMSIVLFWLLCWGVVECVSMSEEGSLLEGLLEAGESAPLYLRTDPSGAQTQRFRKPVQWSKLFFFGVKAGGPRAYVTLYNDHLKNYDMYIDIQIGMHDHEVQFNLHGHRVWEVRVGRNKIKLSDKHFTWFTVVLVDNVVALYSETRVRPILIYRCKQYSRCNFNDFVEYRFSSPGNWAVWDVSGWTYTGVLARERRRKNPQLEPFLEEEAKILVKRYVHHRAWAACHLALSQYHDQYCSWDYARVYNVTLTLLPLRSTIRFFALPLPEPDPRELDSFFLSYASGYTTVEVRVITDYGSTITRALTSGLVVANSNPLTIRGSKEQLPVGWTVVHIPEQKIYRLIHIDDLRRVHSMTPRDNIGNLYNSFH